jgi:hypothetical protein
MWYIYNNSRICQRAPDAHTPAAESMTLVSKTQLALALLFAMAAAHADPGSYNFTPVVYPGSTATVVLGINNSGQISGEYSGTNAFTGTLGGSLTSFAYPNASSTSLSGINNFGQAAGTAFTSSTSSIGFILGAGGTAIPLSIPNAVYVAANSINDSGTIVGEYTPGTNPQGNTAGFSLQANGTFTPINYPGASNTAANGINDGGVVVGDYTRNGMGYGFTLSPSGTFSSASFNGLDTVLYGINSGGAAVGWYIDAAGNSEGLVDKNGALSTFDYPGALSTQLFGINDRGQIAGTAVAPVEINGNPGYEQIGFVASPVPLPGTGWLLFSGLVGLWVSGRRRTQL